MSRSILVSAAIAVVAGFGHEAVAPVVVAPPALSNQDVHHIFLTGAEIVEHLMSPTPSTDDGPANRRELFDWADIGSDIVSDFDSLKKKLDNYATIAANAANAAIKNADGANAAASAKLAVATAMSKTNSTAATVASAVMSAAAGAIQPVSTVKGALGDVDDVVDVFKNGLDKLECAAAVIKGVRTLEDGDVKDVASKCTLALVKKSWDRQEEKCVAGLETHLGVTTTCASDFLDVTKCTITNCLEQCGPLLEKVVAKKEVIKDAKDVTVATECAKCTATKCVKKYIID